MPLMTTNRTSSLAAVLRIILRHFVTARSDTVYRIPDLYDEGVLGQLSRRQNLARGMAGVTQSSLPDGANLVLDIGAGTGILSIELAKGKLTAVAMDVLQAPLDKLMAKTLQDGLDSRVQAIRADMNRPFPFGSGIFDAVTSLRANRYIECFSDFLAETLRVLKPGGVMVLPIFVIDSISWRRRSGKSILQETTSRALRRVIITAGFQIDENLSRKYLQLIRRESEEADVPFYYRPTVLVARKPAISRSPDPLKDFP